MNKFRFMGIFVKAEGTRPEKKNYRQSWLERPRGNSVELIVIYRCILWCSKSSLSRLRDACQGEKKTVKEIYIFMKRSDRPCGCFLIAFQNQQLWCPSSASSCSARPARPAVKEPKNYFTNFVPNVVTEHLNLWSEVRTRRFDIWYIVHIWS